METDLNTLFTVKSRRGCVRVATKNENQVEMAASHSFWYINGPEQGPMKTNIWPTSGTT